MKKYILLTVFALILGLYAFSLNAGSLSAANCAPGDLFHTMTGIPCSTAAEGNAEFKIGSRGEAVRAFQQLLLNAGFSPGRIDGIYGRLTQLAAGKYHAKYPIQVTSPNGGEKWAKSTTETISWRDNRGIPPCPAGTGCVKPAPKTYDIKLIPEGDRFTCLAIEVCPQTPSQRLIAQNVTGNSYQWSIPDCSYAKPCSSNFYIAEGQYRIEVCQSGTSLCDSSNNPFEIVAYSNSGTLAIVTPSTLPTATVGSSYSAQVTATGGTGSYEWTLINGSLPPGLVLSQANCIVAPCQVPTYISGTPTKAGTYTFTLRVVSDPVVGDGPTLMAEKTFTLKVAEKSSSTNFLSINPNKATIRVGETINLQALFDRCAPPRACALAPYAVKAVWTSSNTSTATVTYSSDPLYAVVMGNRPGTVTITASYKDPNSPTSAAITATAQITVIQAIR